MSGDLKAVLAAIVTAVRSHKEAKKIILFGSRARGDAVRTSDIDIAIVDPRWTRQDINTVHDELEETLAVPFTFDLLGYDLLTKDSLKERIQREGIVIHER